MTAVMERPDDPEEEGKGEPLPEFVDDYSSHGPTPCTVLFDADRRKGRSECGTMKVPVGDPEAPLYVCPKCDQLPGRITFELVVPPVGLVDLE